MVAHWLVLAVGLLFYLRISRDQWFFGDDWDFVTEGRRLRPWAEEYLGPHNEHWTTIPLLLYRAAEALFGLEHYLPFLLPVIAAHLASTHLLWRLLLRVGTAPPLALAGSTLFLFLPSAFENVLWAFQIAFVGPLLFGLAALLLVDRLGPWDRRDWAAAALLLLSLAFSGLAVGMIALVAAVQALRRGFLAGIVLAAVPALVYVLWWNSFKGVTLYVAKGPSEFLAHLPAFVATGLAAVFEQTLGYGTAYSAGSGLVLALILFAALARHADDALGRTLPAFACVGGAIVMLGLIAYGRLQLGPGQAAAPRYVYGIAALLLPAVGLALTWLTARTRAGTWVVAAALFLLALNGAQNLRTYAGIEALREEKISSVLGAATDLIATRPELDPRAQPELTHGLHVTVGDLRRWRQHRLLEFAEYDETHRLTAEANLLLSITGASPPQTVLQDTSCSEVLPESLRLDPPAVPTAHRFDAPGGAIVRARLIDPATGAQGDQRELHVPAGQSFLAITAVARVLELTRGDERLVVLCR